jgi:hypothetical protein
MFQVEEKRITNRKLRESFGNIRNISEFVKERQLTWLVHVLKMNPRQNTKKLVNAWVEHPRREGQPQHNLRHSYRKALIAIGEIDNSNPSAPFKEWTRSIVNLPQGSWRDDVKKRLRKWSARNDEAKSAERAVKRAQ